MWQKQMGMQRLHRNYFARALIEHPADPRKSAYERSFTATFESAKVILKLIVIGYPKLETFLLRLHPIWANSLASAVCIFSLMKASTDSSRSIGHRRGSRYESQGSRNRRCGASHS